VTLAFARTNVIKIGSNARDVAIRHAHVIINVPMAAPAMAIGNVANQK
jgi:hypothetical protein